MWMAQDGVNTGMPYFRLQLDCISPDGKYENRMSIRHPISSLRSQSGPLLFDHIFFEFLEEGSRLVEPCSRL